MTDPIALGLSVLALLASLIQAWFTVIKPRRERRRTRPGEVTSLNG